jgi:hypothetical protein
VRDLPLAACAKEAIGVKARRGIRDRIFVGRNVADGNMYAVRSLESPQQPKAPHGSGARRSALIKPRDRYSVVGSNQEVLAGKEGTGKRNQEDHRYELSFRDDQLSFLLGRRIPRLEKLRQRERKMDSSSTDEDP